jgi:membrane fusion protein YbhG
VLHAIPLAVSDPAAFGLGVAFHRHRGTSTGRSGPQSTELSRIVMHRKARIVIPIVVLTATAGLVVYRTTFASEHDSGVVASGTVEATQADLGFQISGRLERVSAREGDAVTTGRELAAMEHAELDAQRIVAQGQVDAARATLAELIAGARSEEIERARATLNVATARRDAAQRDVERLTGLAEQSLISRQAFDHQKTELGVAQGEVEAAAQELRLLQTGTRAERIAAQRAAVAQSIGMIERLDAVLAQMLIRAPFAGTVTVRHREPGEALSPGQPVFTLRNLADRWLRIYVPEDQVGRIALGQSAEITADAYHDRRYAGIVSYIASVAEFTPRNVQTTKDRVQLVYEVRVRITGDSAIDLKPGLPADVRLAASTSPQAR